MTQPVRPTTGRAPAAVPDGMILIPGGRLTMGSRDGYPEEAPVHEVTVGAFAMDIHPVTNREYRTFCDETGRTRPEPPRWPEMPDYFVRYPDHPAVNINYDDAAAYAEWTGKRLPTEAEWEFAARGGREATTFAWGDDAPGGHRAQFATRDVNIPWRDPLIATGWRYTAPTGSFPPNGYGLHDMAGNVWEWCDNWFYRYPWEDLDPRRVEEGWGLQRVVRGGAWYSPAQDLRVSRRLRVHGGTGGNGTGFRCVLDVLPEEERSLTAPHLPPKRPTDPATFDDVIAANPRQLRSGVELCLGVSPDLTDAEAVRIRNLGFTSVEQYVHWGSVENDGEGQFDFSHWDAQVETIKRHGLKWVPFLIAGPAYSLPDWFRESRELVGAVCLEHRLPSKIQSIFDRSFDRHIDRFISAFAERYRDTGVIEAPLLGITGDFGEAIYPVTGTAWTQVTPGPYHTHPGYWCGDALAEVQFREAMLQKYGDDLDTLNAAWGTDIPVPAGIRLPVLEIPDGVEAFRADEPTSAGIFPITSPQDRRRWLDFIDWYRGAMLDLARFWMTTARTHFPDHPIYLCTGGDAPPHHGAHFGEQCRVAASAAGGVRITNEASNYPHNFAVTRWVTSAGRHHGAYTGIEPAGGVDEFGVTCRIYNAAVSGAKNLHFYAPNLVHHRETIDAWHAGFDAIREESPALEVAFLYPDTSVMLGDVSTSDVAIQAALLRDLTDLEYLDDAMIADGALEPFRVLFMACCPVVEQVTLDRIDAWLAKGGVLVILGDRGIESVEGILWTPKASADRIIRVGEFTLEPDDAVTIGESIRTALADTGLTLIDGVVDRVYVAHVDGRLLVLNHTDAEMTRTFHSPDGTTPDVILPANTITMIPLSG